MTNDELLLEVRRTVDHLQTLVVEKDRQIQLLHMQSEQLRDIIAEYEGVTSYPKKLYRDGKHVATVTKAINRRKDCPSCGANHTVRKDGGMYRHWVRKNGRIDLCPGIWMTN